MESVQKTAALISLGCSKNLVDGENMSGILQKAGYRMITDPAQAQIIIVNTCGFLQSAVQEAIDIILDVADYKESGCCEYLIVTGCMSQRYTDSIAEALPEVDAILGTRSYYEIADVVDTLYKEGRQPNPIIRRSVDGNDVLRHLANNRPVSTLPYAYIKVAEGCNNTCSYCAIPRIRGVLRSRPLKDLLSEGRNLVEQGAKELILVGQDTTSYGIDLYNERKLATLLEEMVKIPNLERIRFLYAYANGMTEELLTIMANEPKIMPYIDLPIQHAANTVLLRMNRTDTRESLFHTIERIRAKLPEAVLRTTVMVGFPGETEEEFEQLCNFIESVRFDHLGAFIFSPEEGTAAMKIEPKVDLCVAQRRYDTIMNIQQQITTDKNTALLNQRFPALIEGISEDGIFYIGRIPGQAPEVDPLTYIVSQVPLEIGGIYPVTIVESSAYELTGVYNDEFAK